jgi:O-antigen ligase
MPVTSAVRLDFTDPALAGQRRWVAAGRAMTPPEIESFERRGSALAIGLLWAVSALKATSALAYPALSRSELQDVGGSLAGRSDGYLVLLHQSLTQAILLVSALALVWSLPVRMRRPNQILFAAAMTCFTATVASALFGLRPLFGVAVLGPGLLIAAWYFLPRPDFVSVLRHVKRIVLVYVYGSLIAAAVAPSMALLLDYNASFIGLPVRLNGLTAHANQLGGICVIAIACVAGRVSRFRAVHLLAISICLLLAQSKTSLVAAIFVVAVLALRSDKFRSSRAFWITAFSVAISGLIIALPEANVASVLNSRELASLENLTGRDAIWAVSLDVSADDRIIGYGPTLWNEAMRIRYSGYLGFAPPHAHNQVVQSLATTGVVGLCAMLFFFAALVRESWRIRVTSEFAPLAILVGVVAVRSFAEITLDMRTLSDTNMMAAFLVVLLLFARPGPGPVATDRCLGAGTEWEMPNVRRKRRLKSRKRG